MKGKKAEKRLLIGVIGLFLVLIIFPYVSYAAIPQTINYQGYLTNAAGVPVNGTVQMVFSIYNVATGGAALWTETQSVTAANGVYNVNLGKFTPMTLPFDAPYYLGVAIGADPEMTPRQPLASVAYAFRAKTAENTALASYASGDQEVSLTSTNTVVRSLGVPHRLGIHIVNVSGSFLLNFDGYNSAFCSITKGVALGTPPVDETHLIAISQSGTGYVPFAATRAFTYTWTGPGPIPMEKYALVCTEYSGDVRVIDSSMTLITIAE
jgi:hypothetical protein